MRVRNFGCYFLRQPTRFSIKKAHFFHVTLKNLKCLFQFNQEIPYLPWNPNVRVVFIKDRC